jgi:hypothetical protein
LEFSNEYRQDDPLPTNALGIRCVDDQQRHRQLRRFGWLLDEQGK